MKEIIEKDLIELVRKDADKALAKIEMADKPKGLYSSVIKITEIRKLLADAKDKLKELKKDPEAIIKAIDTIFKKLEAEAKTKFESLRGTFLATRKTTTEDLETGEIIEKTSVKEINNYAKGWFSYKEPESKIEVDKAAILADHANYPYALTKMVRVINEDALKAHISEFGTDKLPTKVEQIPSKVGIQ